MSLRRRTTHHTPTPQRNKCDGMFRIDRKPTSATPTVDVDACVTAFHTVSITGRYDEAPSADVALERLLNNIVIEPIDDLEITPSGVRMLAKNPEKGYEVASELFGLATLENAGGRFWLECVNCALDEKSKRSVTVALRSEGSHNTFTTDDFDEALEELAPAAAHATKKAVAF